MALLGDPCIVVRARDGREEFAINEGGLKVLALGLRELLDVAASSGLPIVMVRELLDAIERAVPR